MYRSLLLPECRRNFPATSETFGGTYTSAGSGQVCSLIPDSMHFSTWWSPWRFGRVDSSVVALAGGQQLQRHPGFRSVLLPRFTGNFFYPGQRPDTVKKSCPPTSIYSRLLSQVGGSIPVLHLAGELLEDFGRAAVVFQLSLNQRCQLAHLLYL